jgi:hypothetical protein
MSVVGQSLPTHRARKSTNVRYSPKATRFQPVCTENSIQDGRGEQTGYGDQEGTAYNGHFACTCYHPLFVFNQFGDLER